MHCMRLRRKYLQLISTLKIWCVRNGNFDEALDLEAFVDKLSTMHPKIPVIQALAAKVRHNTQSLLSQLLQRLRSNIQFLRCREAWLNGILDDLDQRNAYEYLKGMITCHGTHLFHVVNQYRAIFSDDTSGNEENCDGGLVFSWAMHQIVSHLKILKTMLPRITYGGSLSNVLDHSMEREYKDALEVFNEKNKEPVQLITRLMELVGESEMFRLKKLEELSNSIETMHETK